MIRHSLFDNMKKVALAVSGGKDSMALLFDMARQFDHDFFYVINIEHGIRGEESREDSAFVEEYARGLGVECKRFDVDAVGYSREHGYTLEQGARLLRREIFAREVQSGNADRVCVAHHMDDNVESILMHIFRGAGTRGIKGMDEDNGVLLRPLLGVTRADIDAFINENNIPYREDSTNKDTAYRRNFLRADILPELRKRYDGLDRSIIRLSNSAREDDDYLSSLADALIERDGKKILIDMSAPAVLTKRAIYKAFTMLGVTADVEERHYNLLIDLAKRQSGTTLDMPYGVKARNEYGRIAMFEEEHAQGHEHNEHVKLGEPILGPINTLIFCESALGEYPIRDWTVTITRHEGEMVNTMENGYRVLYCDGDKLLKATLRKRRVGDTFDKFKSGTKKLKDYFIDIKLPQDRRDIPIICKDERVLVVVGYEISNEVSVNEDTRNIYKITLRRND